MCDGGGLRAARSLHTPSVCFHELGVSVCVSAGVAWRSNPTAQDPAPAPHLFRFEKAYEYLYLALSAPALPKKVPMAMALAGPPPAPPRSQRTTSRLLLILFNLPVHHRGSYPPSARRTDRQAELKRAKQYGRYPSRRRRGCAPGEEGEGRVHRGGISLPFQDKPFVFFGRSHPDETSLLHATNNLFPMCSRRRSSFARSRPTGSSWVRLHFLLVLSLHTPHPL